MMFCIPGWKNLLRTRKIVHWQPGPTPPAPNCGTFNVVEAAFFFLLFGAAYRKIVFISMLYNVVGSFWVSYSGLVAIKWHLLLCLLPETICLEFFQIFRSHSFWPVPRSTIKRVKPFFPVRKSSALLLSKWRVWLRLPTCVSLCWWWLLTCYHINNVVGWFQQSLY
jgi:hypothetical protein